MKRGKTLSSKEFIRDGRAPIHFNLFTSRVMSANKAKNSNPELILRSALWANGIRGYRLHWKKVPGRPDIAYTIKKMAIFVNGCYWHSCPNCNPHVPKTHTDFWSKKFTANEKRDKMKNEQLNQLGWKVITIGECQLKKDFEKQLKTIQNTYYE
jgi:DNA mismatch endonuclease (patch repair protein)